MNKIYKLEMKSIEDALIYAENIIETVRASLIVLDFNLRVISANKSFYQTFIVSPDETIGQLIYDLGNKQWNIPNLRLLLEEILPKNSSFDDYEIEHSFEDIGKRTMLLNARRIDHVQLVLLSIEDITERKILQEEMEASEERYRRAFETSQNVLLLVNKSQGDILDSNTSAEKLLGYSPKELLKKKLWEIGVIKDDKDFQEAVSRLEINGVIHYEDTPMKAKNGLSVNSEVFLVDKAKVIQCNIRDITEQKQAEEALNESDEYFRIIFENAGVGMGLLVSRTGEFVKVNRKYADFVGYTIDEMEKLSFQDITHLEDIHAYREFMNLLLIGKSNEYTIEKRYLHKNGSVVWGRLTISPLWFPEEPHQYHIAIVEDITQRKKAEIELTIYKDRLEDLVNERTAQMEEKNAALEKALSSIKTLKALLPICSNCKKVREDKESF